MSKNSKRGKKKLISLAIITLAVFLTGFLGSLFTSQTTKSEWYLNNKPSFTPPGFVFSIAWTILYLLIILAIYFSWTKAKQNQKKKLAMIFGINLLANALWSVLFFGMRKPFFAFLDLLIIFATIILAICYTKKISKPASALLVPYLLWIIFAGILNLAFIF